MEIPFLNLASEAAEAAYPDKLHQFSLWQKLDNIHSFSTNRFDGYVASNEESIILSFRGTQNNWNSFDSFVDSISQWMTNLDFQQIVYNNFRVHRGFNEEINSSIHEIVKLLKRHDIDKKELIITGHSAGGAMATLAGHRLYELGKINKNSCQVISFSSPKVGDSNFVSRYPLSLIRVESKNDLVPFFPLHPFLSEIVGELIYPIIDFVNSIFPKLNFYDLRNLEYLHAGELLYLSQENELIRRNSGKFREEIEEVFDDLFEFLFGEDYEEKEIIDEKIITMPNEIVDVVRVVQIFEAVDMAIKTNKADFFKDHGLNLISTFLRKLMEN